MTSRGLIIGAMCAGLSSLGCAGAGDDARVQLMLISATWVNPSASGPYALAGPANLAVTVKITNNQLTPLPLTTTHFVLGTSDGFVFRAAPGTSLYPGGCSPNATVAAFATVSCTVLFSFNGFSPVAHVGYEFDDKASSTERITVNKCTFCGGQCVDLQTDWENCGTCGNQLDGAICAGGKPACTQGLTACGSQCVNLLTDTDNCGACGNKASGARCVSGTPTCDVPQLLCGGSCTYVSMDENNCGRCGAACPSTYSCVSGSCQCAAGTTICGSGCADLSRDNNNCGACGKTCASNQYCSSGYCYTGSSGSGGGGGSSGGCSVNCGQFGLSCCGSSCC